MATRAVAFRLMCSRFPISRWPARVLPPYYRNWFSGRRGGKPYGASACLCAGMNVGLDHAEDASRDEALSSFPFSRDRRPDSPDSPDPPSDLSNDSGDSPLRGEGNMFGDISATDIQTTPRGGINLS